MLAALARTLSSPLRAPRLSVTSSSAAGDAFAPVLLHAQTPGGALATGEGAEAILAALPDRMPSLRAAAMRALRFCSEAEVRHMVADLFAKARHNPWYFLARSSAALQRLVALTRRVLEEFSPETLALFTDADSSSDFETVVTEWLEYLFDLDKGLVCEKVVLVILGTFFTHGHVGLVCLACNVAPVWASNNRTLARLGEAETHTLLLSKASPVFSCSIWLKAASGDVLAPLMSPKPALLFEKIKWVGFDVDHTLVEYNNEQVDMVTIDAALGLLSGDVQSADALCVSALRKAKSSKLQPLFLKLCLIDVAKGDLLQLDGESKVRLRLHGSHRREEEPEARLQANELDALIPVHTHFERIMIPCFAELVDLIDAEHVSDSAKLREELYQSGFNRLLTALAYAQSPLCPNSISDAIANKRVSVRKQPRSVVQWLQGMRAQGMGLFLLTDAREPHVERVMTLALGSDWASLFDVVICDAKKSTFFAKHASSAAFAPSAPQQQTHTSSSSSPRRASAHHKKKLGLNDIVSSAPMVVYFGDHVQKDVVNPNVHGGWRTVAVVSEVESDPSSFYCPDGSPSQLTALVAKHASWCVSSIEVAAKAGLFVLKEGVQ